MAKRKKKESIEEFRKRTESDGIMDTSADEMMLDVNAKDEDVRSDGLIETRLKNYRRDDMVFSMRMNEELLHRIKQAARVESAKRKVDIPYQMLICEAVDEKYPKEL